ncbi:MAG: ornithine cyclodeaminase family protein [Bacteroidota bacterium]|nr:ornithine cyclodeaminase family protein [Bacteroidota bacterium]
MALLLSRSDVQSLLSMGDCIEIIEEAFRCHALGNVVMPQRTAIRIEKHHGLHLGMPAYIGGETDALGLKVVTVYPDNPARHGLPTTMGLLLLNDPATGAPLAVMDAGFLTGMRTGAVSGVATKYLARTSATRLGVFGAGVMAYRQVEAVCVVRPIKTIHCFDIDTARAENFASQVSASLGVEVRPVPSARDAVENMDIIVTATSAARPVFDGTWLVPGQHINGIGSHSPAARELDTATIVRAKAIPDSIDACLVEAGDFLIPIDEGAITKDHLRASLGEVIAGLKPGRESPDEITLFKSVGLALQDVSVASAVYRKALEAGVGFSFSF